MASAEPGNRGGCQETATASAARNPCMIDEAKHLARGTVAYASRLMLVEYVGLSAAAILMRSALLIGPIGVLIGRWTAVAPAGTNVR